MSILFDLVQVVDALIEMHRLGDAGMLLNRIGAGALCSD
jgi:hypothetical protein